MVVNGLRLPESFVALIDRPMPLDSWVPIGGEEGVDAYGHQLGTDLELFNTVRSIEEKTNDLPVYFKIASLTPERIENWTVAQMQRPGFIPYITDFSQVVCFGRAASGERYCFDYRENPDEPSIIHWDDGYWRRIAPNFDALISLYKPFDLNEEPPPDPIFRPLPSGWDSRAARLDLPPARQPGIQAPGIVVGPPGVEQASPAEVSEIWPLMMEGRYTEALQQWDGLMAQDSRSDRYRLARGTTLLLMGDPLAALADLVEARKAMGLVRPLVPLVGTALWLQGKREEACDDWAREIAQNHRAPVDDASGVQVPALIWWAAGHAGLERYRFLAIVEFGRLARIRESQSSIWPDLLGPFLLGKSSAAELLAGVPDPHPFRARWLCQAHFYLGAKCLAAGDLTGYRRHLELAVSQGGDNILEPEYHLARAELSLDR